MTGTVSYADAPITEGTVTFENSSTGFAEAFHIETNGSYSAKLPAGGYGVSIQPPTITIADSAQSEGGEEFKKVDNIPPRYWSAYESKLTVEISDDKVYDIDMVKGGRR